MSISGMVHQHGKNKTRDGEWSVDQVIGAEESPFTPGAQPSATARAEAAELHLRIEPLYMHNQSQPLCTVCPIILEA